MTKTIYTLTIALLFYFSSTQAQTWSELGGLNGLSAINPINSICSDAAGNMYVSGSFTNSSGNYYVAKYNGSTWAELGGLNGLSANSTILSICSDAAGNIYAAGNFTNSSGNWYIAKYNGSTWTELGGLNSLLATNSIISVCNDAAGNIYASGFFTNSSGNKYVAKYNGSIWTELGGLNGLSVTNPINSICGDAVGNIYAGGSFTNSSGNYYVAQYTCPKTFGTVNQTITAGNSYLFNGHSLTVAGNYNDTLINQHGCDSILTLTLTIASGINDITSSNFIHIFPNPTNNITTITLTKAVDNATIKLINITGQIVMEKENQSGNHFNLDISQQAKGIYFIEVQQDENIWREKVVKE